MFHSHLEAFDRDVNVAFYSFYHSFHCHILDQPVAPAIQHLVLRDRKNPQHIPWYRWMLKLIQPLLLPNPYCPNLKNKLLERWLNDQTNQSTDTGDLLLSFFCTPFPGSQQCMYICYITPHISVVMGVIILASFVCVCLCLSVWLSRLNWRIYKLEFWRGRQVEGYLGWVSRSRSKVKEQGHQVQKSLWSFQLSFSSL